MDHATVPDGHRPAEVGQRHPLAIGVKPLAAGQADRPQVEELARPAKLPFFVRAEVGTGRRQLVSHEPCERIGWAAHGRDLPGGPLLREQEGDEVGEFLGRKRAVVAGGHQRHLLHGPLLDRGFLNRGRPALDVDHADRVGRVVEHEAGEAAAVVEDERAHAVALDDRGARLEDRLENRRRRDSQAEVGEFGANAAHAVLASAVAGAAVGTAGVGEELGAAGRIGIFEPAEHIGSLRRGPRLGELWRGDAEARRDGRHAVE